MKDSVNTIVGNKRNPFLVIWRNYIAGVITTREVQKKVGEWQLKRIQNYKYQQVPPMPKGKKYIEGWLIACGKIKYENISNEHRLRQLLARIDKGILEAEQGKVEEIGEILDEYPRKSK